jgi:hypothetical protein
MIEFRMQQIKIEQFAILSETPPTEFYIENHFSVGVDTNNHTAAMRLRIDYRTDKDILLTLTLVCSFSVNTESWQQLITDNKVIIPRGFIVHMAVHTLGTARGVLFAKTESSEWQNKILPPTNVDEVFKNDLTVQLPSTI